MSLYRTKNKSFFASFFSKKEESSFPEEKEAKRLLFLERPYGAPSLRSMTTALRLAGLIALDFR
jgi:hypothetical protein